MIDNRVVFYLPLQRARLPALSVADVFSGGENHFFDCGIQIGGQLLDDVDVEALGEASVGGFYKPVMQIVFVELELVHPSGNFFLVWIRLLGIRVVFVPFPITV